MYNNEQPFWFKTWVIVVAFIFCWPIGIVLLIGRINSSKQTMLDGSKTTRICMIVGVILILVGISGFSGRKILTALFYIAGGAALIYFGQQNKKKVERYRGYIDLVANQKVYSLDTISNTMNVNYDTVRNDLQKLISKGSFRGATINELTRSIDVASPQPMMQPVMQPQMQAMYQAGAGMVENVMNTVSQAANTQVTAKCPGCGGTTVAMKGATVECDYCGKIFTAN